MGEIMQCGEKFSASGAIFRTVANITASDFGRYGGAALLSLQTRYLIEFKLPQASLRLPATRRVNHLESHNTTVKESS